MRNLLYIFLLFTASAFAQVDTTANSTAPAGTNPATPTARVGVYNGKTIPYWLLNNKWYAMATQQWVKGQSQYVNVVSGGLNGNGTFDNTAALATLKSSTNNKKILYFPQNASGNAVYYFSGNVDLNGWYVVADPDVVISTANTNGVNFAGVKLLSPLRIYSRDRDNYGEQMANTNLPYDLLPLADRQTGEVMRNGVAMNALNDFQKAAYDASTVNKINNGNATLINNWQVNWFQNAIQASPSADSLTYDVVEQPARLGKIYSATLLTNSYATGGKGGIMVWSANEWVFFGINNNGITLGSKRIGNAYSQVNISPTSNAYKLNTSSQPEVSARVTSKNTVDFYINKHYVYTSTLVAPIQTLGFGFNRTLNQLSYQSIYNPNVSDIESPINGRVLKGLHFGDSITFGEGSGQSWPEYLKRYLIGKQGISDVIYNNNAISGQTAAQQLEQVNAATLTGYDYIVVMVGTNDIQAQTNVFEFRNTIKEIGNRIKNKGAVPIFGISPMFIDKAETGYGFETSNFDKGAYYRTAVKFIADSMRIQVADVNAVMGEVSSINKQLRDNIHPEQFYDAVIAQAIGNAYLANVEHVVKIDAPDKREGDLTIGQTDSIPTKVGIPGDRVYNTKVAYGGLMGWVNVGGNLWDGIPTQRYVFDHPERSRVSGIAGAYSTGHGIELSYNNGGFVDSYDYELGARQDLTLRGKNINLELFGGQATINGNNILNRQFHTGVQPASTISDFGAAVNSYILNNGITSNYSFLANQYTTLVPTLQAGDNRFGLGANDFTTYIFSTGDVRTRSYNSTAYTDFYAKNLYSNDKKVQIKELTEYVPGISGTVNTTDSVSSAVSKIQTQIAAVAPGNTRTTENISISTPGWYTYVGTAAGSWTLPAATGAPVTYYIKNAGAATLTINSSGGGNDIFISSAVNTFSLAVGELAIIHFDGVQYQVRII